MSLLIDITKINAIHFTGIFGSGMSAIAQFLAWKGTLVSGSDRSYNNPETARLRKKLEETGCAIFPQDGSGIGPSTTVVCISSAIESDNPDIIAAGAQGIPIVHRSDILSAIVKSHKTIAVAGTSGKSTVTAMIFEFLTACGKCPSLITGAPLIRLERQSYIGNAFYGLSDYLVIEADESDGTIVKYTPYISVILNLSKDHKPIDEIASMFKCLIRQSSISIINSDDPLMNDLGASHSFSLDSQEGWHPDNYSVSAKGGVLYRNGIPYHLHLPGKHNLSNLAAALSVGEATGCDTEQLRDAVASFEGVSRRFSLTQTDTGVIVVDDFAHNPEKIRAAVTTARLFSQRIIALYQPHGFGPVAFLRDEYRNLFKTLFSNSDILILLPIYYAGGTADKTISSEDLKNDIGEVSFTVKAPKNREAILPELKKLAKQNDCILVMGARDRSLPLFVEKIISQCNHYQE